MKVIPIKSVASVQQEFTKKFEQIEVQQRLQMEVESKKLAEAQARLRIAESEARSASKSIEAINKLFGV